LKNFLLLTRARLLTSATMFFETLFVSIALAQGTP
jgi:hypothetical protein